MNILKNLQVVLVRPENPANIGQVARAMKNFGFLKLTMVGSTQHLAREAFTLGWHAKDILENAPTFDSLHDAVKNNALVVGMTRRNGRYRGEPLSILKVADRMVEMMAEQEIALVFGNEKNGLSNEELSACHEMAAIPTVGDYQSLNLSHAVVVTLFTILNKTNESNALVTKPERFFATPSEIRELMSHFQQVLRLLGYHQSPKEGLLERTLGNIGRLFQKASLEKREFQLFNAFLARIEKFKQTADNNGENNTDTQEVRKRQS